MRTKLTWILAASLLLAYGGFLARANTRTLVWTNPSFNTVPGDSINGYDCYSHADSLHDLAVAEVWDYWEGGGGWKLLASRGELGMEGQQDSLAVDVSWGYHFYVIWKDFSGNQSCPSNVIYLCGPCNLPTGVGDPVRLPTIVKDQLFDVRGRTVNRPGASGVYFRRIQWDNGHVDVKKEVIIK